MSGISFGIILFKMPLGTVFRKRGLVFRSMLKTHDEVVRCAIVLLLVLQQQTLSIKVPKKKQAKGFNNA